MKNSEFRRLSLLGLTVAAQVAAFSGCTSEHGFAEAPRDFGAVGFKLTVPSGLEISKVLYTIKKGSGSIEKANEVVIAGPGTTFAAKIDRIPAGDSYTITLETKDAGYRCAGSAGFDIKPHETTTVAVRLRCPGKSKDTGHGSLLVEGDINICPVIDNAVATPKGDGTYSLSASGSDSDGAPSELTYRWIASAGTVSSTTTADATFTCPAAGGDVSVVLELSDGDTGCSDVAGASETLTSITCDGGGPEQGGAGAAGGAGVGGAAGSVGGLSDGATAECRSCREQNCRDYQGSGVNLPSGCFASIDTSLGANASDPNFLQDCVDFVDCAQENDCAYGANGASDCYCGSASPDNCINVGPANDAKCVLETQQAARSSVNADITLRFSDLAYPLGWAYFLLECDNLNCPSCKP